jgi:hypothetical protein
LKAVDSIDFTDEGIETEVNSLQLPKALYPIDFTWDGTT